MGRRRAPRAGLLLAAVVVAAAAPAGCRARAEAARATLPARPEIVAVPVPTPSDAARRLASGALAAVTGSTEPARRSTLASKVPGIVAKVLVDEGQHVEAGTPLVQLDRADLELGLRQARAAVRAAEVQLRTAETEYARAERLLAQQAIAPQQVDLARARVDGAKVGLQQARIAVERATKALEDATIRAPYAAVVTRIHIHEGEYAAAMPPTPLVTLEQHDPIVVRLQAPPRQAARLRPGTRVRVRVPDLDVERDGEVARLVPSFNPMTRTASVLVELDNPDGRLAPGLFAEATPLSGATAQEGP